MMITYTSYIWLPLISALLVSAIALYAGTFRNTPASQPFRVLMWLCALFSYLFVLSLLMTSLTLRIFLAQMLYIPAAFITPTILIMVIHYTGHTAWITRWRLMALLLIPMITVVLVLSYPLHTLLRYSPQIDLSGPLPIITFKRGSWYWVHQIYGIIIAINALAMLIASLRNPVLRKRNTLILIFGIATPFLADIPTALRITPIPNYTWTSPIFVCIGMLYGWALLRGQIFAVTPIARGEVMDHINDLVIVLDNNGRIADFNRAMQEICEISRRNIGTLPDVLPSVWADLLRRYNGVSTHKEEVIIGTGENQHVYDLVISTIRNQRSQPLGRLFILHDVTVRRRNEELLRKNEERFRQMVETMPIPLTLTRISDGTYLYVNHLASDHVGLPQSAMIGKQAISFYADPRVRQIVLDAIHQNGSIHNFETQLKRIDGSTFWALFSASVATMNDEQVILSGVIDISERKKIEEALRYANDRLEVQLAENKELQSQLREQATHDVLTSLFNRRYMQEILDHCLTLVPREMNFISVLMIDIDHFKKINDAYGHKAGDLMLQAMGTLLRSQTRQMDTACRYGGEEFVIIMPTATLDVAVRRANDLRHAFANLCVEYDGRDLRATISIGVATFPTHGGNSDTLLHEADQALYMAKATGRNRVYAADESLAAVDKLLSTD